MPEVRMSAEPVEISVEATAVIHSSPPQAVEAPGGLFPLHSRAFEMDDYRLLAGWPVEVPPYDVKIETLISCSGEVLTERDNPWDVQTDAMVRWIATDDLWDPVALRWSPLSSQVSPVPWEAADGHAPVLVDYEYRLKDERFRLQALNFDSDSQNYLTASFGPLLSGVSGYTLLFVMSPNSTYSNNVDVPYNGLWCPTSKSADYVDLTMQGRYLWHQSESAARQRVISINPALNTSAPFYVAVVVDRPYVTMYVAEGPTSIRVQTVPSGKTAASLPFEVFLGRSTEDLLHTADMALLDLSIYSDRLTGQQIRNEIALLAQCYGGES